MGDLLRRLVDEKTATNQLAVTIGPNKYNVAVSENVALGDDAFRVYLLKLAISRLRVVLEVRHTDDLHPFATAALVVFHSVAELGQFAKSFGWPFDLCNHVHASKISVTLPAM